jgi:antirestriction protein
MAGPAPRIYAACLAAYSSGRLHGAWIDADQSPEDIQSAIADMLAASPEPSAEEWAIHDYEGFGELHLSEWESFDRISAIAAGVARYGSAFAVWLSYDESRDPADLRAFEEAYRGEWESLRAYAEDWANQIGLFAVAEQAGSPYVRVDIDALERDLDIEMYTAAAVGRRVHVFDANV